MDAVGRRGDAGLALTRLPNTRIFAPRVPSTSHIHNTLSHRPAPFVRGLFCLLGRSARKVSEWHASDMQVIYKGQRVIYEHHQVIYKGHQEPKLSILVSCNSLLFVLRFLYHYKKEVAI